MLPIRLTLEGIYSYRERQTIDFERLTQARLFGIFGAVGSGKSAILEAMVYAVYGTIDRLSTEVRYNVMNLQADRLFVDFEFLAGDEGRRWRAVVDCKRNRKRFEEVSSPKFSYYVWEDEDWLPCTRKEVTDAIGLSAQNFKRVVIIPQGKFQEFLNLVASQFLITLFAVQKSFGQRDGCTHRSSERFDNRNPVSVHRKNSDPIISHFTDCLQFFLCREDPLDRITVALKRSDREGIRLEDLFSGETGDLRASSAAVAQQPDRLPKAFRNGIISVKGLFFAAHDIDGKSGLFKDAGEDLLLVREPPHACTGNDPYANIGHAVHRPAELMQNAEELPHSFFGEELPLLILHAVSCQAAGEFAREKRPNLSAFEEVDAHPNGIGSDIDD